MYGTCCQHGRISSGRRCQGQALCNAERRDHDPSASGGAKGQETEIRIVAEQILKTRERLNQILAENTGKPLDIIAADTERDNYMTAEEAKAYGLVDHVITKRS
nr:ATP-dependent Clp protease proteolytic subunit [Roseburia sp. AM59-24XD]